MVKARSKTKPMSYKWRWARANPKTRGHIPGLKREMANMKHNTFRKSAGHVGFTKDREFFKHGNDIYSAPRVNYVEKGKVRVGARFESTKTAWDAFKKIRSKKVVFKKRR